MKKAFLILSAFRKMFFAFFHILYKWRKTIFLIITVAAVTLFSHTLIAIWLSKSYGVEVPSIGTITVTDVEVYGENLTYIDGLPSINWGDIKFGTSKNVSIHLRNTSNIPMKLAFNATDWHPEAIQNYVTLSWNYGGRELAQGEEILVRLTLTTSGTEEFANYLIANNVNSYNFTMYIYPQK